MALSDARNRKAVLGLLAAGVVLGLLLHVGFGASLNYTPLQVLRALGAGPNSDRLESVIVWNLRLPRALACVTAGALLGGVGSVFQALFKNRLADPYIIGTSSGAAVGGVTAILLGFSTGIVGFTVPLAAFVTGMLSLGLVMLLARRRGVIEVSTLLLAGVLVGSLLNALQSLALYMSGQDAPRILNWLLGSVTPMYWNRVATMAVMLVGGGWVLLSRARQLNALALGDDTAAHLGVDVASLKRTILICGAAMTAAAVGSTGMIGFVGLVAPHLSRRLLGVDWRYSLLGSFFTGALMLLFADALGQRVVSDGIPVGVITALIGAPSLLILLGRKD